MQRSVFSGLSGAIRVRIAPLSPLNTGDACCHSERRCRPRQLSPPGCLLRHIGNRSTYLPHPAAPQHPEVTPIMPTRSPRPAADDPWCGAEGTPIALRCRVEQIAVDPAHGALPCRLYRHGQVVGRGIGLLYVIFDYD